MSITLAVSHGVILLLGLLSFVTAFISSLAYLLQQRQLKLRRPLRALRSLPSLEMLDRFVISALILGFIFLTAGLFSGVYFAHKIWTGRAWVSQPFFLFSALTWCWFVFLFVVRYVRGWRGTRFFALIVIGFLFLLFTVVGIPRLFPEGLHRLGMVGLE